MRLWYDEPATNWETEALAIGNGYMGGLVYGGITQDKVHINEKTVWYGGPYPENSRTYTYGNTNATETEEDLQVIRNDLQAIRDKLEDKSEHVFGYDADAYVSSGTNTLGEAMDALNKLMGDLYGYEEMGYVGPDPYANLLINFQGIDDTQVSGYVRDLDLRTALATVSFDYEGAHYTREYFNSYPDNVLVVRLSADQEGKISFNTDLVKAWYKLTGSTSTVDGDTVTLRNTLKFNQLQVESQLKVIPEGGELTTEEGKLTVKNADAATLILACGTDYKMELPEFRGEDPHAAVNARVAAAAEKGYEALKADHVSDHAALFSRLELDLDGEIPQIPTDELVQKYRNLVDGNGGEVPTAGEQRALEVLCYQFGRYLTIAGSREGSLPTNLQGVWGEKKFSWGGDYHFNINIQMNYWPTLASNLAECQIPYNDYLNTLRVAGQQAVEASFGIENDNGENGWLVGCFSTPYMFASMGQKNNAAGWNPVGSAWALLNAYEYYLYTGDMNYLKDELYPSMKSVANFWDKALYWSESQQRYVSSPSYSPENGPIVAGASYDQQFIWQHFENTIAAAEALGVDADLVQEWREKQSKLNPVMVGADGQIKEWYEETSFGKAQAGDLEEIAIPQWRESLGAQSGGEQPPHRHLSHLMALYPCTLINKDNATYMNAALVSLKERGLDATGWAKGHKLNLWARTGHGEEAFALVQSAVGGGNSGFLTNLLSSHGGGANYKERPIFQIDGNFGYTAGVNEMLLQSQLGYVQFLPTLPKEWSTGRVDGIVARGNFEIDMQWTDGVADGFAITSRNGGTFTGEYPGLSKYTVVDEQGSPVSVTKLSDDKISFATTAGKTYTIGTIEEPEEPGEETAENAESTSNTETSSTEPQTPDVEETPSEDEPPENDKPSTGGTVRPNYHWWWESQNNKDEDGADDVEGPADDGSEDIVGEPLVRYDGAARQDVAVRVAQTYFPDAKQVILVQNLAFADALSANNIAQGRMPILYAAQDSIPQVTWDELNRVEREEIFLVGGPATLSEQVEQQLVDAGFKVTRIGGRDRYELNAKTAEYLPDATTAVLASGMVYSDALSAAPYAFALQAPILLTGTNQLPQGAEEVLTDMDRAVVVGGPKSVSSHVFNLVHGLVDGRMERIAGADRYEVAATIAERLNGSKRAILTSGEVWSDALVAGPVAQQIGASILLTRQAQVPEAISDALSELAPQQVVLLGGVKSVGTEVEESVKAFIAQ